VSPDGDDFILSKATVQRRESKMKEIRDQDNHTNDVNGVVMIHHAGPGLVMCGGHFKRCSDNIGSGERDKEFGVMLT
jgi:hypothetical protein